eukprot:GHVS01101695.1.p1 GENE.GHVS01101695.1~~GHVS01101695.1.p1  ORF type:complete len:357 (+),score=30.30 GHVS01101695.1:468-1538(+)
MQSYPSCGEERSTYDTGSKPSLSLFELTLRIAQDLNHQTVTAVLVNCDGPLNVEYRVAFDNGSSGGGFTQFSCTEQGLLAAFGYFTVISGALFLLVFTYRQSHKQLLETTSAAPKALLVSAGSYFLSQLLTLCHLVAYASDGIGLNAFQFLGQLINCVSSTLLCCVLMWWCHGGSISASVISDQQQTNMNRCCLAFGATSLLYTLVQTELSVDQAPFFVPTDWCAIPHIVVRLAVAAYAYGCASTLKRAERRTDKRFFYGFLRGMMVFWFLAEPFYSLLYWATSLERFVYVVFACNWASIAVCNGLQLSRLSQSLFDHNATHLKLPQLPPNSPALPALPSNHTTSTQPGQHPYMDL